MHRVRLFQRLLATAAITLLSAACATQPAPPPTVTPAPTPIPSTATPVPPSPTPVPPTPTAPTVVTTQDVVYLAPLAADAHEQRLDIYAPPGPSARAAEASSGYPIVVFAHGYRLKKGSLATVSRQLAEAGAVVFTPDWPADPSSAASWREMTEALGCAVRFARVNALAYGGDPDNVTLAGFSMGATIGAQVALGEDRLMTLWEAYAAEHDGPGPQVECTAAGTPVRVDAFVGISGAYDLADRFEETDPDLWSLLTQLGDNTGLRVRLLHGDFDSTVPAVTSEAFADRLEQAGFDVELTFFDSGHTVPRELTVETVLAVAH